MATETDTNTDSPKPVSEKRLAANRANATHSTGPRTPEGKERSAQNARKHGFASAKFAVVRLEELDALANLRADAIACYQPANSQELFAVERIALAQMALLRVASLEAGLHTEGMNETVRPGGLPEHRINAALDCDIPTTISQNRSLCLAVGFERVLQHSDVWKIFLRYQAQTERLYRRAVEEFERLKALRAELPNEPIADIEPEEIIPPKYPELDPNRPLDTSDTTPDPRERDEIATDYDPTVARTYTITPLPVKNSPDKRRNRRDQE